jgi:glutamine amidotransferase
MITIIDYGMGNLGSMLNMFRRIGVRVQVKSDPHAILDSDKLVLPGVGAFDAAMHRINNLSGLREAIEHKAHTDKVPILGVCLGMQLLTDSSEEGALPGLGWIPGKTIRFPRLGGLKVPHMGWNTARPQLLCPITECLSAETRYYFVHSYYVKVNDTAHSAMITRYGLDFDSAIARENIFGVQFHPEKSHRYGMQILKNFSEL